MTDSILQSRSNDAKASLQQRFREGSDAAFDEVIECYSPAIQQLAYRLLGWNGEVDDIVQDVFVAALAYRKKFRSGSSLKTWLFTITINTCRSRNRRHLLWRKFIEKHSSRHDAPAINPVRVSLDKEQAQKVHQAAQRLPQKYRDVIVLKYLEELPTEQILEILKISEKAFYTRLSRARNLLQQDLSEYLENENG